MPAAMPSLSRRTVIRAGGAGLATLALVPERAAAAPPPNPVDLGRVEGGTVVMPPINAEPEGADSALPKPRPPGERIGFAILGLGRLSLEEILPAFGESRNARPVALVSGSPDKAALVAGQYGLAADAVYGYGDMARLADNKAVQVVYVVTPNALHRENVLAAFAAGKHVLCEKPMALNSAEARDMIAAAKAADRKLMIAYRCQYEPNHLEIQRLARTEAFGRIKHIEAVNTQNITDPNQWRMRKALSGGGSLPNIGIYCLNGARMITGEEPVEVFAQIASSPDDPRFREVEETVSFTVRFPSGVLASLLCSHGTHEDRTLKVNSAGSAITLENAFAYRGQRLRVGVLGQRTHEDTAMGIIPKNQFAAEMDHFADCVRDGVTPRTPGEEGLQDMVLMEAIYESARTGRPVTLDAPAGKDAFRGPEPKKAG